MKKFCCDKMYKALHNSVGSVDFVRIGADIPSWVTERKLEMAIEKTLETQDVRIIYVSHPEEHQDENVFVEFTHDGGRRGDGWVTPNNRLIFSSGDIFAKSEQRVDFAAGDPKLIGKLNSKTDKSRALLDTVRGSFPNASQTRSMLGKIDRAADSLRKAAEAALGDGAFDGAGTTSEQREAISVWEDLLSMKNDLVGHFNSRFLR